MTPLGVVLIRAPMHFLLMYDVVDDYVERRAPFRREHIALAREAVARGEAGAREAPWRSQPMASCCCSAAVRRPQPRRLRNRTRMCATES